MRRVLVLLLALAACGGSKSDEATTPTTAKPTTSTTQTSPDDAFLADLHDHVDFNNPEWGEQAINLAKQACDSLDASRLVMEDDAPNDTPQTDAALADWYADTTLSVIYDTAGEDQQATASVIVLGARHFCPEYETVIAGDATGRGLTVN